MHQLHLYVGIRYFGGDRGQTFPPPPWGLVPLRPTEIWKFFEIKLKKTLTFFENRPPPTPLSAPTQNNVCM